MLPDIARDPFHETSRALVRKSIRLLGARFRFDSNSPELLRLVASAYRDLPCHRLSATLPDLRVTLLRTPPAPRVSRPAEPWPLHMLHAAAPLRAGLRGACLLGGASSASNVVMLSPRERTAVVVVSPQMLRFPYHTRYEMIEFAVFTLAARAQQLVPLHAACVGTGGRGILLMGESGAGKSTVALQCLLAGFDFLAEDSVFIAPATLLATGVPNFLHVRADSVKWLGRSPAAALIRRSPVIRRRSGVRKFELDLRQDSFRLAPMPLKIVAAVFLSRQGAEGGPLLRPLSASRLLSTMAREQGYAARQPQWRLFKDHAARLAAFELRRGRHPLEAVEALREVLSGAAIYKPGAAARHSAATV